MTVVFNDEFEKKPRKEVAEAVDDFEWAFDERGATLTGVAVRDFREARIPAEVDGRPVVAIGARAFGDSSAFLSFHRNSKLKTVVFPENSRLTSIGESAFEGCYELQAFEFPSGIKEIGACAFKNCWRLKRLVFPAALRKIGESAFYRCMFLASVKFPPDSELTTIEKGTFSQCVCLEPFHFPSGLEEIGEEAFWGCRTLRGLVFPASLRKIGESAFYDCARLWAIKFPANSELTTIGRSAFGGCEKLRSFEFPSKTTEIGEYAFRFCYSLESLTFPASLRKIGESAFRNCDALETVVFPPRSIKLGSGAFGGGKGALKKVVFPTGQARFADDWVFYRTIYTGFDDDDMGDLPFNRVADMLAHYDEPYGPDDDLTFVAPDGTPVAEYAAKNGINRVAPERD